MFGLSCNNGALRRKMKVTIEKFDFEHDGVPQSLQFHWVVDDDPLGAASRMAGRVKAGLAASFPRPRLQRPRSAWERAGV